MLEGDFSRQLFLGESLDRDHITAGYDNGVLTLTIPVTEAAKPRRWRSPTPTTSSTKSRPHPSPSEPWPPAHTTR